MKTTRKHPSTSPRDPRQRRGAIAVLSALLLVLFLGMVAFAVDAGYILFTRTQLQAATDSAALAGASQLVNGTGPAQTEAVAYMTKNVVGGKNLGATNTTVEFGNWDSNALTFTVSAVTPNAVRITATDSNQPLFFGKLFGNNMFSTTTKSVAIYQPRDIGLVLDYSGSMCYDSQFRNIGLLGQSTVESYLHQIWTDLGSPTYGNLTYTPVKYGNSSTSNTTVINNFGLNKVSYPYSGGSWSEYVDYVQTDSYVSAAGYQNCYGMETFLSYLQADHCSHSDTPVLYKASEEPVTALKDAVDVFLSYLTANCTDDRVSLTIYTYSDNTAILEQALTSTFSSISTICRARQAGHYTGGTNISAGMTKARTDLIKNGRVGALKMMVVMTDGVVNLPTGNTTTDKNAVINEANLAAAAHIPIVTICVGALADTALMQQVADITGGAAFVVPGGQPISAVQTQLQAVFGQVASDRPLKLVQ